MKTIRMFVATLAISSLIGIASPAFAAGEPATKDDIRFLIEQMDKRFEQIERRFEQIDKRFEQMERRFEQIDKRFEQVDKRFEQVDKRFEFTQALLLALFAATIGMPFWIERQRKQHSQTDLNLLREVERLLTAMREAAVHNPQFKELLTSARLL